MRNPTPDDYERVRWAARHPVCWACKFCGHHGPAGHVEVHHIAGRGKGCDVPANWAPLCREHHAAIQSLEGAEVVMLVLKREYDPDNYDPRQVCRLRGKSLEWITDLDVVLALPVMRAAIAMAGATRNRSK